MRRTPAAWLSDALSGLRDELRRNLDRGPLDARTTFILVLATVLLTLFHYYGKSVSYARLPFSRWLDERMGLDSSWDGILPYAWWGMASIGLRVLVPLLLVAVAFGDRPRDYGLTLRGSVRHLPVYGVLYLGMLPFLLLVSTWDSFRRTYPFWEGAQQGGIHLWVYEALYGLQFVGVEFFFRGLLTFALCRRFGYHGLLLATIPYVMIHFNKPLSETLGALIAGVVLGYLAWRSRTIVPGILLHAGIAWTMDLLALRGA
jgi:membrane protease YdiL (CAAX protease family)